MFNPCHPPEAARKLFAARQRGYIAHVLYFAALFCASCDHGGKDPLAPPAASSVQLPDGRVTMGGGATRGGWPHPILESIYGGYDGMAADDKGLGLMYLVIIPPKDGRFSRRTDTGPNVMQFEWPSFVPPVTLRILYDPLAHSIEISGDRYPLQRGNYFVIREQQGGGPNVKQLPEADFEAKRPAEALEVFKRKCKDVQEIQEMKL
jgi:hypothetical protein